MITIEGAQAAILARPEDDLGLAVAHACYAELQRLQRAGDPDGERGATIVVFAHAKGALQAEAADLDLFA